MTGQTRTALLVSLAPLAALAALAAVPAAASPQLAVSATAPVAAVFSVLTFPGGSSSGGAPILSGGLAPTTTRKRKVPAPPSKNARGHWLGGVTITEYWPAPESWFVGKDVSTPGLPGEHKIDWLYSAAGMSMQGDGIGLDGRLYHIQSLGQGGWVTAAGDSTSPANGWQSGAPFWRAGGYWRNRRRGVTFPLATGGWSAGRGRRYVPLRGVTFALGASLPLRYYHSIAVDPGVIPLGSRVYVRAYRRDGKGGWFVAQDTGGAINGRHIDVYRPPPSSSSEPGQSLVSQRIYVIKPRH